MKTKNALSSTSRFSIRTLITAVALSLSLLGSRHAIACDDVCDDDAGNTSFGSNANSSDIGLDNTAFGTAALANIDSIQAVNNVAIGAGAMQYTTSDGSGNSAGSCVAVGYLTLLSTLGQFNTAIGYEAMETPAATSVLAFYNTATGSEALYSTQGSDNTADGAFALFSDTTGSTNTAVGRGSLFKNTEGSNNTAVGYHALNLNAGSNNIAVGNAAGVKLTTGSNNIDIGAPGIAGESNTIRIGSINVQKTVYIHGIRGATAAGGINVIVDSAGHLGTTTSSARFKDNIQPMSQTSEAILSLKPVTFRYKKDFDSLGIPQFGLVAEEVAKVDRDLVAYDDEGKPYSVRYDAVNAMLLNEFLKEHHRVEAEISKEESLAKTVAKQQKQIDALMSGLQKVSAELATSHPLRQVVTKE